MPEPQDKDGGIGNLVTHFIMPNDEAANLARCIGIEFLTDPGKLGEAIRGVRELLDDMGGCIRRHRLEKRVQTHQIRRGSTGPGDPHLAGGGNGRSVDRLSAHAWML